MQTEQLTAWLKVLTVYVETGASAVTCSILGLVQAVV